MADGELHPLTPVSLAVIHAATCHTVEVTNILRILRASGDVDVHLSRHSLYLRSVEGVLAALPVILVRNACLP